MYYKTIFAIAGAIATLAMIAGMAVIPNFQTAAAANDRCVSEVNEGGVGRSCYDSENKESAKQHKDVLKDLKKEGVIEKVSSSQTGFGEIPNSKPSE
jgi:hypothetical protein